MIVKVVANNPGVTSSCTQIDLESISDYFLPVIRVNLTELILHAFYKAARRLLELSVSKMIVKVVTSN